MLADGLCSAWWRHSSENLSWLLETYNALITGGDTTTLVAASRGFLSARPSQRRAQPVLGAPEIY